MKKTFREHRFNLASLNMINTCNEIIEEYMDSNLRLTLRQLYYQLVSRGMIANENKEYKKLSSLISNGRLCGLIDWDSIEDRVRQPYKHPEFDNIKDLVEAAAQSYRLPRWKGQNIYAELWVEKDALAGVLHPIAQKYHITLMVNRGYSSQSAMYESAQRIKNAVEKYKNSKGTVIFYLGDLDPSGEDMVRDIQARLDMFGAPTYVKKIALNMDQVDEYNPPPNPTKPKDPRATEFLKKYGQNSWEVDALPPTVLTSLITHYFDHLIDTAKMKKIIAQEKRDITALKSKVGKNKCKS